jgi:hypothetical protein
MFSQDWGKKTINSTKPDEKATPASKMNFHKKLVLFGLFFGAFQKSTIEKATETDTTKRIRQFP